MDYFAAIVLGIIQGIAEWLPISSKSIVALAGKFLFGMDYQEALSSAIFLHCGTLLAAVIYFRNELWGIFRSLFERKADRSLLIFLIVSTIVTGLIGAPLLFIALNVEFPEWLFTIFIGILLTAMAVLQRNKKGGTQKNLTVKNALVAGVAQGLAGIPGVSRSGTTLAALLGEGYSLEDAMKLSFLMSIPAVAGVELFLPIIKGGFEVSGELVAGCVASAVVGFLTIDAFLKVSARPDFYKITLAIGVFVIALGILLI